jgi:hypothetical protein
MERPSEGSLTIEVTDEMIEAGVRAYACASDARFFDPEDTVVLVYEAMATAGKRAVSAQ